MVSTSKSAKFIFKQLERKEFLSICLKIKIVEYII